jgi:hypothetical protein
MPPPVPRKLTPEEQEAAREWWVRAARAAMFDQMRKEALDG